MHVFSDKNKHIQALTSRERKFLEHSLLGLKVPWSESSKVWKEQLLPGTFVEELVSRLHCSIIFQFLIIDTLYRGASIDADIASMFRKKL